MDKVSIVIPYYNHWNLVQDRLQELYKFCSGSVDEVVLVDDASTEESGKFQWLPVNKVTLEHNSGFLLASNFGLKYASGDVKILLSNDVCISGNFITPILDILKFDKNSLVGGRLLAYDTGWNKFGDKIFPYLEGWMLAATKEAWETMEYFDERYVPNDFEDVDLSSKALAYGYELKPLFPNFNLLNHIGAQSIGYNTEREALTNRNKEKFSKKWIKK